MNILWHSVKYPPKKDGKYYISKNLFHRTKTDETGAIKLVYYRDITTIDYSTKYGWNAYVHDDGEMKSTYPISDEDYWAEVEYVSD